MRIISPKTLAAIALFMLVAFPLKASAETFSVPELSYRYDALAPVIDAQTMETHHSKHHQGYVNNLNKAITDTPDLQNKTIEQILASVSGYGDTVRNNAGGHWNHSFFWSIMAPQAETGQISEALNTAITEQFGSLEAMKEEFATSGASRFGSGWVWLVVKDDQSLAIVSTPNQDNPLMDDTPVKGRPILGNDVWEHAYYLNYQNRRADYLRNWWQVVNWTEVSANYDKIRQMQ